MLTTRAKEVDQVASVDHPPLADTAAWDEPIGEHVVGLLIGAAYKMGDALNTPDEIKLLVVIHRQKCSG